MQAGIGLLFVAAELVVIAMLCYSEYDRWFTHLFFQVKPRYLRRPEYKAFFHDHVINYDRVAQSRAYYVVLSLVLIATPAIFMEYSSAVKSLVTGSIFPQALANILERIGHYNPFLYVGSIIGLVAACYHILPYLLLPDESESLLQPNNEISSKHVGKQRIMIVRRLFVIQRMVLFGSYRRLFQMDPAQPQSPQPLNSAQIPFLKFILCRIASHLVENHSLSALQILSETMKAIGKDDPTVCPTPAENRETDAPASLNFSSGKKALLNDVCKLLERYGLPMVLDKLTSYVTKRGARRTVSCHFRGLIEQASHTSECSGWISNIGCLQDNDHTFNSMLISCPRDSLRTNELQRDQLIHITSISDVAVSPDTLTGRIKRVDLNKSDNCIDMGLVVDNRHIGTFTSFVNVNRLLQLAN